MGYFNHEDLEALATDPELRRVYGIPDWVIIVGPGQKVDEMEIGDGQLLINFGEINALTARGNGKIFAAGGSKTGMIRLFDTSSLYVADTPAGEELEILSSLHVFGNPDLAGKVQIFSVTVADNAQAYLGNKANVGSLMVRGNGTTTVHPDGVVGSANAEKENGILTGMASYDPTESGRSALTSYKGTINPLPKSTNADSLTNALPSRWTEAGQLLLAEVLSGKYTSEQLAAMRAAGELPEWLLLLLQGETAATLNIRSGQVAANLGGSAGRVLVKGDGVYIAQDGASTDYLALDHHGAALIADADVRRLYSSGASTTTLESGANVVQMFGDKLAKINADPNAQVGVTYLDDSASIEGVSGPVKKGFHTTQAKKQEEKAKKLLAAEQAKWAAINAVQGQGTIALTEGEPWTVDTGDSGVTDPGTPGGPVTPADPLGSMTNPYIITDMGNSAVPQIALFEYIAKNNIATGSYIKVPDGSLWHVNEDDNKVKGVVQVP